LTTTRNVQTELQPLSRRRQTERLLRPATTSTTSSSTQTINNATITTTITTTTTTDDIEDDIENEEEKEDDSVDNAREIETSLVFPNSDETDEILKNIRREEKKNTPILNGLACSHCGAHLAYITRENLVSASFTGRNGPAMLLTNVINTFHGNVETRQLMTGGHTVADIFCTCGSQIGWYYLDAKNIDQKYKIGKSVIENAKSKKITLV
jgi:hypothetical protein